MKKIFFTSVIIGILISVQISSAARSFASEDQKVLRVYIDTVHTCITDTFMMDSLINVCGLSYVRTDTVNCSMYSSNYCIFYEVYGLGDGKWISSNMPFEGYTLTNKDTTMFDVNSDLDVICMQTENIYHLKECMLYECHYVNLDGYLYNSPEKKLTKTFVFIEKKGSLVYYYLYMDTLQATLYK